MKMAEESSLEDAVLKWHVQRRSCGVNVRVAELKSAANTLANHTKGRAIAQAVSPRLPTMAVRVRVRVRS
jgi:hypothetical protein